jgi:hypothetical protein
MMLESNGYDVRMVPDYPVFHGGFTMVSQSCYTVVTMLLQYRCWCLREGVGQHGVRW